MRRIQPYIERGARVLTRTHERAKTPRTLSDQAGSDDLETSAGRLNALRVGMPVCTTYLEVGVQQGLTLERVEVPFRWGVDPFPSFNPAKLPQGVRFSQQESDQFFAELEPQSRFDLVFLDGLHEWRQTYRDLLNALNHTPRHGLILIDDVVPDDEFAALPVLRLAMEAKASAGITTGNWQGNVFKIILALRDRHPELEYRVIGAEYESAQAIVWKRPGQPRQYQADRVFEASDPYESVSYADVFPQRRIPPYFNPADTVSGIAAALAASQTE